MSGNNAPQLSFASTMYGRATEPLMLFQQKRRLSPQYWKKAVRQLGQEPRQRHFDAQRVLQHFNAPRRNLSERAHAEAQRVALPGVLLHRNRPKLTAGAGEAFFNTADRLDLPEVMADDDRNGVAHDNGAYADS